MRSSRIPLSAMVIVISVSAIAAERPVLPAILTLKKAIAMALDRNTSLRAARLQTQQAEARAGIARAALMPQISIDSYQSEQSVNLRNFGLETAVVRLNTGPFSVYDARLSVEQDVFNLASLRQKEASREEAAASLQREKDARDSVVLSTVDAYLSVWRNQCYGSIMDRQVNLAGELLRLSRLRFDKGLGTALEVSRAAQELNRLQGLQSGTEAALISSKVQLANWLNAKPSYDFTLADPEKGSQGDFAIGEDALPRALGARADYQAAQREVRAAEFEFRAAEAARTPVVKVGGDGGFNGNDLVHGIGTFRAIASVNIPIFTGGSISARVEEARARHQDALRIAEEIASKVEMEILISTAEFRAAGKKTALAEQNVTLAEQELDLAVRRLKSGVADNTDVLTAQDHILQAEDARLRGIYEVHLQRAKMRRALGEPFEY